MADDNIDRDMKKLMGELDDDMGLHPLDQEPTDRRKTNAGLKGKILFLSVLVIAVVIIIAVMLPKRSTDLSKDDLSTVRVQMTEIEKKLAAIDEMRNRISDMENREKGHQQQTEELNSYLKSLMKHVDNLTQKVDTLEKGPAVSAVKKAPAPTAAKPKPQEPKPAAETQYHTVQKGENLYRISLKYGIALEELCRINDMTVSDSIQPGQRLLVKP